MQGGGVVLPTGIANEGPHTVCHAFALASSADVREDSQYEPQRGISFEGVNRSTAVAALSPNVTFVNFDTTVRLRTKHPGYVRLVRLADGSTNRSYPSVANVSDC